MSLVFLDAIFLVDDTHNPPSHIKGELFLLILPAPSSLFITNLVLLLLKLSVQSLLLRGRHIALAILSKVIKLIMVYIPQKTSLWNWIRMNSPFALVELVHIIKMGLLKMLSKTFHIRLEFLCFMLRCDGLVNMTNPCDPLP